MPRLRTVNASSRGWTRRKVGRGFVYLDENGERLPPHEVERIRALAIPPAWKDVWICPFQNGHLQAVGTDAAGRRQYLYHPQWRVKRDQEKFDRVLAAARRLPQARRRVLRDLAGQGMTRERAAAAAVRLLDLGYFRIGNDAYTEDNGSFGLTTLERHHVRRRGDVIVFRFVGKSGIEHTVEIDDAVAIQVLERMRRRRSASRRLLAYQQGRRWSDLDAATVNAYLRDLLGGEMTAKDFRTWHATVLAAVALATSDEPGDTPASRKRAIKAAVQEVSEYLGNTPTIAKSSYIDPRVLDRYESGSTIEVDPRRYRDPERRQAAAERALLALLAPAEEPEEAVVTTARRGRRATMAR
jgi:DNA topoisomerase IB